MQHLTQISAEHSPLFIGGSGYDGDIAETFMCCRRLLEGFGFNIIIFDGPGQVLHHACVTMAH